MGDDRRIAAAPWLIIAGIGPQLPRSSIRGAGSCLVGEQALGSSQPVENMVSQVGSPFVLGVEASLEIVSGHFVSLQSSR